MHGSQVSRFRGLYSIITEIVSGDIIPGTIWLGVHGSVAIISACLPTYRPLLSKIPGLLPLTHHGSGMPGHGNWLSWRKDSIEHTLRYDNTLVDSHSIKDTLTQQPRRTDLPMLNLEASGQPSFASSANDELHNISEDLPRIDPATARARFD